MDSMFVYTIIYCKLIGQVVVTLCISAGYLSFLVLARTRLLSLSQRMFDDEHSLLETRAKLSVRQGKWQSLNFINHVFANLLILFSLPALLLKTGQRSSYVYMNSVKISF